MANSANPEINKKIATSALGTLVIATVFFYLGDRYAETLVTYPGQIFDHLSDAFLSMWQTIKDAPFALDMTSNSLLFGGACFLIIWMIWLVICEDGIYAIADWEFNQNVPAIDAMREGNRVRKASERARKNGKGTRQLKKDKVVAYLTEHPDATNTEVAEKTGVSRPSVIKYRREYAPALPAPKGGKIVKDDGTKVDTVKIDGVKVDSFDSKVDVNFDVKVDSDFDTGFYTDADGKSAGRQSAQVENEAVKIASRPKNIDDRYKNTATSTAIADGEGTTGSGIPTREEVRSHFAEMGFAVDPDRFFDVNEGRGWRTNSGKPVDDWKKLAAVWDRNEHPKAATPPARTEPKANAVGKIPSVEEVMAKWGCDRETAQGYIDENMY